MPKSRKRETRTGGAGKPSNQQASEEGVQKSHVTILEQEIEEGLEELERPSFGLFMSGLSAGLDIGFSVLLIALVVSRLEGVFSEPVIEILKANAYSVGFILVIFGRSELFTEHTTLAALPVLARKASLKQLSRLWGLVYVANIVGTVIFAWILVLIGTAMDIIDPPVFGKIAHGVLEYDAGVMLFSAILAGWLMGLVSWLVTAGRDTISEIFFVWLVTGTIGFAHFHHGIVGSVEVLAGIFAEQGVTWLDFGRFAVLTALGNALGGVFFVAVIKYAHATSVRRGMRHLRPMRGKRSRR